LKEEHASLRRLGFRKAAADNRISAIFGTVARKENDSSTVCRAAAPSAEVRIAAKAFEICDPFLLGDGEEAVHALLQHVASITAGSLYSLSPHRS
jgi:hypothetical protein